MSTGELSTRFKQLAVIGISLTVAPLIVAPQIVMEHFTVNASALELMGYPTMVFSGFLCAVNAAYGCAWFAVSQQIYNVLAIKLTTGTWVVILAWFSYALNTCATSYMAVCAVRARWQQHISTFRVPSSEEAKESRDNTHVRDDEASLTLDTEATVASTGN
jgi:hypothetical protein